MTLKELDENLKTVDYRYLRARLTELSGDPRPGVQKLVLKYRKKLQDYLTELQRLDEMMVFERKYAEYELIAGIDEAGRGPLAGPVVAACVILPKEHPILYCNDSKKLSEKKREELYDVILKDAVTYGVGMASEAVIDDVNILNATYQAMRDAIRKCDPVPTCLLNDAVKIPEVEIRQVPIIKGDAKSLSIAAASILAKVTRDRIMKEYDLIYPEYDFRSHKGYGSQKHIEALKKYGPCPIHRRSFIGGILNE